MREKKNFTDTKPQNKRRMGVKAKMELTFDSHVITSDCGKECS